MEKFFNRNFGLIGTYMLAIITIFIVLPVSWDSIEVEKAYSYLLSFSGIFSAIVITAIISKVFIQRQENILRKEEIINLSNKVSDLRRIAKTLIDNDNIWPTGLKNSLNTKHKNLTYEILIDQNHEEGSVEEELVNKYVKDTTYSETLRNLYLALKSIKGDTTERGLFLYTNYDYKYTYKFNTINSWVSYNTANSLWYTFEHKYAVISNQLILANLHRDDITKLRIYAKKIDAQMYSDSNIPINKLLSDIGTQFDSLFLPRLSFLLYANRPILPMSLSYMLNSMIAIMVFGTIIPIFLQSVKVYNQFIIRLDIAILLSCVIVLLYHFKTILTKELDVLD